MKTKGWLSAILIAIGLIGIVNILIQSGGIGTLTMGGIFIIILLLGLWLEYSSKKK